jgi:hypothetical protein
MSIMTVVYMAIAALGLIQYFKGWYKKAPSKVWSAVLPLVIVGVAAAFVLLPAFVGFALLALAVAQLGYETVFQILRQLIKTATGADIGPRSAEPSVSTQPPVIVADGSSKSE